MTRGPRRARAPLGTLLAAAVVLAALTEAIAGSVLGLGRGDIMGDVHATPDEFAWLDVGYTAMKFVGFVLAPWLLGWIEARRLILWATLAMGGACVAAALTTRLEILVMLRFLQGMSGGLLLVGGQVLLFRGYPRAHQPLLQAVFAMGAVVAPATLAPALQGWLIDSQSWTWIFLGVAPLSLAAAGLLLLAHDVPAAAMDHRPFDPVGFVLIGTLLCCLTYVFSQGGRWDWFEAPRILWPALIGTAALAGFIGQQVLLGRKGLLDLSAFRTDDFTFAFVVSFVAGAALFGSAYLIPAFALSVLAFTLTAAGLLLLPSAALFIAALLLAAFLMQVRRVPPIATVPLGIISIMIAMWMLSRSTGQSGADDMMAALLVRGLGLGFLFLSITLIAFAGLPPQVLASGIGLFNTGRQLGGLMGVAGLQTLIDHNAAANQSALAASITPGSPAVAERLSAVASLLAAKGIDPAAAAKAAAGLLGRVVTGQSTVIAFETAFQAVAFLFVVAIPFVLAVKIALARRAEARARWAD